MQDNVHMLHSKHQSWIFNTGSFESKAQLWTTITISHVEPLETVIQCSLCLLDFSFSASLCTVQDPNFVTRGPSLHSSLIYLPYL